MRGVMISPRHQSGLQRRTRFRFPEIVKVGIFKLDAKWPSPESFPIR